LVCPPRVLLLRRDLRAPGREVLPLRPAPARALRRSRTLSAATPRNELSACSAASYARLAGLFLGTLPVDRFPRPRLFCATPFRVRGQGNAPDHRGCERREQVGRVVGARTPSSAGLARGGPEVASVAAPSRATHPCGRGSSRSGTLRRRHPLSPASDHPTQDADPTCGQQPGGLSRVNLGIFCRPFGAEGEEGAPFRGLAPTAMRPLPLRGRSGLFAAGKTRPQARRKESSARFAQEWAVRPVRGEGRVATGASPWNRPPPPSLKPRKGRQNRHDHGRRTTGPVA